MLYITVSDRVQMTHVVMMLGFRLSGPDTQQNYGTEKIEALQDADNPNIYNRAYKILTTYFNIDDDQDDSAMAPQVQGNQFTFGNNPGAGAGNQIQF